MSVMFDYVEIVKYLSNGCFNENIIKMHRINIGYSPMKVFYNNKNHLLTIRGSLPYFMQGHNFFFNRNDTIEAIKQLEILLEIDLYDAEVKIMEYGVVVNTAFTIDDFLENHLGTDRYMEDCFSKRGKNYIKNDRSSKLKFYSIWANVSTSRNKMKSSVRKILENGEYCKSNNPMRYEIHGNPNKILHCGKILISDMLTLGFEKECQKALLNKYDEINKKERLLVTDIQRLDIVKLTLILLSEYDGRFMEKLFRMIDKTNAKNDAKRSRKAYIKKLKASIPHEKCFFSIEDLIKTEFTKRDIVTEGLM